MTLFAHEIKVKDMLYPARDSIRVSEEENIVIEEVVSDISDYLSDDSDCSSFSEYSSGWEEIISPLTTIASTHKIVKLPHSFVKLERCDHLLTLFPGKKFYGTFDVTRLLPSPSSGRSRRPANLFYSQDYVIDGFDKIYSSTNTEKATAAKKSKYCPKIIDKKQNVESRKPKLKKFSKNKKNCRMDGLACAKGGDVLISGSRSKDIPKDQPVPVYMTYIKDDICTTISLLNGDRVIHNTKYVNGSMGQSIPTVNIGDANICVDTDGSAEFEFSVRRRFPVCRRNTSNVNDAIYIDASDEDSDIDIESNFVVTNLVTDKEIIDHDHSYALVVETVIPRSRENQVNVSSFAHQTKSKPDENKPMSATKPHGIMSKDERRSRERSRRRDVRKQFFDLKDLFLNLKQKEHLNKMEVLSRALAEISMLKKVNRYLVNRRDRLLKYEMSLISRYKKLRKL